jgi:cytoskeletal protein CcmA (bactofilin family)
MFGNNKERSGTMTAPNPTTAPAPSRKNNQADEAITAYLGPDVDIEGTLRFENSVLIEGKFKGEIQSEHGTLVVGESAEVEADITGGNVAIRGKVTGSVTASERVHLQDRGVFSGQLTTPSLQMDESVTFDGSCTMPRPGQGNAPKSKNKSDDEKILDAVESVKS